MATETARDDAADSDERRTTLSWLDAALLVGIVVLVAVLCVPSWLQARKSRNEAEAVGALKTIMMSESVFREGDKEHDGNLDYGMLSELSNTALVDAVLGAGTRSGYLFEASYSFQTSEFLWFATANTRVPTITGERYFVTSAAGVIFYTTTRAFEMDTASCTLPYYSIHPYGGK